MTTAEIRGEDGMATEASERIHAQPNSGSGARKQSAEKGLTESHRHIEWTQRIEESWQGHLETLQKCVCELLLKNQHLKIR